MKYFLYLVFFLANSVFAQNLSGKIRDTDGKAIEGVAVGFANKGTVSDQNGFYKLQIPENQLIELVFSHIGFEKVVKKIQLSQKQTLNIVMLPKTKILEAIELSDKSQTDSQEASSVSLNPLKIKEIPTPFGDFNQALSGIGMGLVNNSELSASYSVRGGNFDENLVYVNNIEIYRPFLVRAGQQEGLSFVNPDLVKSVRFSSGGWQAQYGDKLSSVLTIDYKNPIKAQASANVGLLGATAHTEGKKGNFSYIMGIRHKEGRYLLNTLETKGQYFPQFTDFQTLLTYNFSKNELKNELSLLAAYSRNRYQVIPQSRETDYGTFNQVLRLYVAFEGVEILNYDTWQTGLKWTKQFSENFTSNFIASGFMTREREYTNSEGGYRLCDVNRNLSSPDFNRCATIRGIGSTYNYSRNLLDASIITIENRNEWKISENNVFAFGAKYTQENILDKLNEYAFTDSADFITISDRLVTENNLQAHNFSAYAQNTSYISDNQTLTVGLRIHYRNLNGQTLWSPRLQYSYKPHWKRDISFNLSAGVYQQPPFYREMRNFEGKVNTQLQAQTSYHLIAGMNWDMKIWQRPFKIISELYYKHLNNVVPYDMDNVRLRYYGQNSATGYVSGFDVRFSGEFVKDTESWISLSLMQTQENVNDDERGYIRRPSDQRLTVAVHFEDYLPNNPSFRVNIRAIYGSGLPFGVPNQPNLRSILNASSYRRLDMGFSKILDVKKDHTFFPKVWIMSLDVLNLLGVNNVISYLWIKDFTNNYYAVPNGLSQRFFNLKIEARF